MAKRNFGNIEIQKPMQGTLQLQTTFHQFDCNTESLPKRFYKLKTGNNG